MPNAMSQAEPIKVGFLMDYLSDSRSMDDAEQLLGTARPRVPPGPGVRPDRPAGRDRLPERAGPAARQHVKAVIDAFGELVDEGCVAVHRAAHQRQRGDGAARDRAAVPGAGDQRLRFRALAGGVDVPAQQRLDDRRADPLGAPDGQGRPDDRGCAGASVRTSGPSTSRTSAAPRSSRASRSWPRRRSRRPGRTSRPRSPRCTRPARARSCTAGSASVSRRSTPRSLRSTGIRRATWAPRSRPASTSTSGTRTAAGSASSSTTRGTRSVSSSSTSTRRRTVTVPSTTARCSGATARWRCSYAFADAAPLSPLGVKEALERVKMLPAACGSPGTRISFGPWLHRGWVGAGYLVRAVARPRRQGARRVLEVVARRPLRRGLTNAPVSGR